MAKQPDTSRDLEQQNLRPKVAHTAEILREQGPISTFIHSNPFHNFGHFPFEQAVAETERLLDGRGQLLKRGVPPMCIGAANH